MPDILAQVELGPRSGFAEDTIVNTFAFSFPAGSGATEWGLLADRLQDFYALPVAPQNRPVMQWYSRSVAITAGAHTVKVYDITGNLNGDPHGSPIYEEAWGFTTIPDLQPLPREVALAMTLRGTGWESAAVETPDGPDLGTAVDRPKQRKTGKIYLGPFAQSANDGASPPYRSRPIDLMRTDVLGAADRLAADVRAITPGARWCVWSRADEFLYTITHVQVDDAWDTQRRRGEDPVLREQVDVSS